jgi:ribose transport system permease protein
MGQMLALLSGGFDLAVGTIVALFSVVGAMAMAAMNTTFPDVAALMIIAGLLAGMGAGLTIGTVNGLGVSLFNLNPFMMTLGMSSVGFGIALYLTGGVPVYGLPATFSDALGFGSLIGIPTPVLITAGIFVVMYFLVNWTRIGSYFYAVGAISRPLPCRGSTPN